MEYTISINFKDDLLAFLNAQVDFLNLAEKYLLITTLNIKVKEVYSCYPESTTASKKSSSSMDENTLYD